jgi:hypothetical protein
LLANYGAGSSGVDDLRTALMPNAFETVAQNQIGTGSCKGFFRSLLKPNAIGKQCRVRKNPFIQGIRLT